MRLIKLCAICAVAVLCLKTKAATAQPYRILTQADFLGTPRPDGRGVVAYTNCTLNFSYHSNHVNGEYLLHASVRLTMNNYKSWLDRSRIINSEQLSEILKHEQGHYNIAYLEQQEVLRTLSRTRFTANYRQEAMDIFDRIDARYKQLNQDYEEDTQNMVNRQQQHSWDVYFAKRLQYISRENASL